MGRKYMEEYKADVLKLADEIEVSAACQRLGISTKTVYNCGVNRATGQR